MKKIIKILLFVLLVLIASLVYEVNATDNASLKIEVEEPIKGNDEIIVKISAANFNNGILAIQGTLVYDKEIFEILETTINNENFKLTAFGEETGIFMIEITDEAFYSKEAYIYSEETILKLRMKIKDGANVNSANIELKDCKVVDSEFQTIEVTPINKEFIIYTNNSEQENIIRNGVFMGIGVILVFIIYLIRKKQKYIV